MHFLLNTEECIKVCLPTRVTHFFLKKSVRVVVVRSNFLGALFEFVALYDLTPLLSTVNSLSIGRCSLSISSDAYLIMVKRWWRSVHAVNDVNHIVINKVLNYLGLVMSQSMWQDIGVKELNISNGRKGDSQIKLADALYSEFVEVSTDLVDILQHDSGWNGINLLVNLISVLHVLLNHGTVLFQ